MLKTTMSPFEPAVALMNRLRYPQKFLLVSLVFAVPLGLMMLLWLGEIRDRVAFARDERVGLEYTVPLARLLESLDELTQVDARRAAGADASGLGEAEARVAAAAAAMEAVDARLGARLRTREAWRALSRRLGDGSTPRALVADVRRLIAHAGDTSRLILDPELDTYT